MRMSQREYEQVYQQRTGGVSLKAVKEECRLFFAIQKKDPSWEDWNAMYNTLIWRAERGLAPELLE